jgi:nickel transport protein
MCFSSAHSFRPSSHQFYSKLNTPMIATIRSFPWLAVAAITVITCVNASAHDILLLPANASNAPEFSLTIKYGHPADYSLPDREKIFVLDVYPAGGGAPVSLLSDMKENTADTLALKASRESLGTNGVAIIGARFDNGYYAEVDKDHYYNTSKRELPTAEKSGHYLKFAKALVPVSPSESEKLTGYDRVLGYRLELIPQENPFSLKAGDVLPVQVLFDGKPVEAGVEVDIISGEFPMTKGMELPIFKTNEHGIAKVKLERSGTQSLGADRIVSPSLDPQLADVDNYASSLSFVLSAK